MALHSLFNIQVHIVDWAYMNWQEVIAGYAQDYVEHSKVYEAPRWHHLPSWQYFQLTFFVAKHLPLFGFSHSDILCGIFSIFISLCQLLHPLWWRIEHLNLYVKGNTGEGETLKVDILQKGDTYLLKEMPTLRLHKVQHILGLDKTQSISKHVQHYHTPTEQIRLALWPNYTML